MQPLEYHPEARWELLQAQKWYEHQSPGLGVEFLSEVQEAVHAITTWPKTWPRHNRHFRRFLLRRFPFAVIYRPFRSQIIVIAVMHLKRRPSYWKARLH